MGREGGKEGGREEGKEEDGEEGERGEMMVWRRRGREKEVTGGEEKKEECNQNTIQLTFEFPVGNIVLASFLSSSICCHSFSSSAWTEVEVVRSRTMSSFKYLRRCL
jgi:hypothetical protein